MVKVRVDDRERWAKRAAKMRVIADDFECPDCREMLLRMADDYDRLAEIAEQRAPAKSRFLVFSRFRLGPLR